MFTVTDFLDPTNFHTDFDIHSASKDEKYRRGLADCTEFSEVCIGINDVWSATGKNGALVRSYERIGYHPYTADLLLAFLDSDCAFFVYRDENGHIVKYDIRAMQAEGTALMISFTLLRDTMMNQHGWSRRMATLAVRVYKGIKTAETLAMCAHGDYSRSLLTEAEYQTILK